MMIIIKLRTNNKLGKFSFYPLKKFEDIKKPYDMVPRNKFMEILQKVDIKKII